MSTAHLQWGTHWEWRRVGAWSGSFAAHLLAIALLTAPWAASRINPIEVPRPTFVVLRDPPPPALPQPPPPLPPPPQLHPHKATTPVRVAETTPMPGVTQTTSEAPTAPALPSTPRGDAITQAPAAAAPGIAQQLAYNGALRPAYPIASVRAREQGTVILRVLVGVDGSVREVEIERSSGHSKLDAAAREAVLRGRFRPVMRDGAAVPAWGLVPIEFHLDRV
ncbi:MAG: energy transducer TonB [Dokdonella sp.]